jgi:uncharacterized protein YndB with AHSA1/START domain
VSTPSEPRSIEKTITIDAPPEVVWTALTDAQQLANWFPVEARVTPGPGGAMWMKFFDESQYESPIGAWEDHRHLQLIYAEPSERVPHRVALDYFLEGEGGRTVLRLVQSGFSRDAAWDAMYDGTERGWACMLGALKHFLERHRGVTRDPIVIKHRIGDASVREAWDRLFGPYGLCADGRVDGLGVGDRYAFQTVDADTLQGTVRRIRFHDDFEGTLENLNDGLIRVQIDDIFGKRDTYVTLWTWGVEAREVAGLRKRLGAMVATLFPTE